MKMTKWLPGAALVLGLSTAPVHALTYDVGLLLDDYTYESVDGGWAYTRGADPVSIVGEIETDGSFGMIDAANILSWSLTISSTSGSQNVSSEGLFGRVHTYGTFEASATELSAGMGAWGFLEYVNQPTTHVIGRLHGRDGNLHTFAIFNDLTTDCSGGACTTTTNQGNLAIERNTQLLGTVSAPALSNADAQTAASPLPVPVPASLGLLLSAFAVLGLFGRRRRQNVA